MNWRDLATKLIPVAAAATGNADIEAAGEALERAINTQLTNQTAATGTPRDELLKQHQEKWDQNVEDANDLLKDGHE